MESGLTIAFRFQGKLAADCSVNGAQGEKHLTQLYRILFRLADGLVQQFQYPVCILAFAAKKGTLQIVQFLNADQGTDRPGRVGVGKYKYTIDVITGR